MKKPLLIALGLCFVAFALAAISVATLTSDEPTVRFDSTGAAPTPSVTLPVGKMMLR